MAKVIYACSRRTPFDRSTEARLREICKRLEPDNLSCPAPHTIAVHGHLAYALVNGRNAAAENDCVLLGCVFGSAAGWREPGSRSPEGSYAIFRNAARSLEILSDAAASRTVWYFFDDDLFVASTSQRAIVMFLGSFEFNPGAVPWMLSTGSLGPEASWDRRIRRLPPDACAALDKASWSLRVERRPIVFAVRDRTRASHRELLLNDLRSVMRSLSESPQISFDDCLLPLSGGYDSRAILCLLAENGVPAGLKAITWGLEQNIHRKGNDAAVAKEVAHSMGVRHRYFHTDLAPEPVEKVLERFIRAGEGRIDHLSAYMDGLETWRKLAEEEGCRAVIRGDEGFGWIAVSSEMTVRFNLGMALCSDYRNLEALAKKYRFAAQELPSELRRGEGETLAAWRDRLYHAYRLPTILAALSDIKHSYVEIVNPLLARTILERVRELPDPLRTDKALFKEIVDAIGPRVPYAHETANENLNQLLGRKEIVGLVRAKLGADSARGVLDAQFLAQVSRATAGDSHSGVQDKGRAWRRIKSLVPRAVKNWVRDRVARPVLDPNVLAFRAFLVVSMHELLSAEAQRFQRLSGTGATARAEVPRTTRSCSTALASPTGEW
jgi:asparagine synthetase B (glutamine-hydrolysing)